MQSVKRIFLLPRIHTANGVHRAAVLLVVLLDAVLHLLIGRWAFALLARAEDLRWAAASVEVAVALCLARVDLLVVLKHVAGLQDFVFEVALRVVAPGQVGAVEAKYCATEISLTPISLIRLTWLCSSRQTF